jgi:hypothetical protein
MAHTDGSLARRFDFGELTTTLGCFRQAKAQLRLAGRHDSMRGLVHRSLGEGGPDKYKVLDHRRVQAQMKARRLLDLL